jgi:hypothetical protein
LELLPDFEARRYARLFLSNPDKTLAAFESSKDFRESVREKLKQNALGRITDI